MIVYLSGAMEFADDEGSGWRKNLTKWLYDNLGHEVYDPVIQSAKLIDKYGANEALMLDKNNNVSTCNSTNFFIVNKNNDIV